MATGPPGKSQAWNLLNKLIKVFTNLRHLWGGGENKTEKDGTPELEQAEGDAKDGAPGVLSGGHPEALGSTC